MPFDEMIFTAGVTRFAVRALRNVWPSFVIAAFATSALPVSLRVPLYATEEYRYQPGEYIEVTGADSQTDGLARWNLPPELAKTWRVDVMRTVADAVRGQLISSTDALRPAEDLYDDYLAEVKTHFAIPPDETIIGVLVRDGHPGAVEPANRTT